MSGFWQVSLNQSRIVKLALLVLALVLTASCSPPTAPPCPVTQPNGSTPPGKEASELNHGDEKT
jgi:hypothetical protein